MDVSSDSQEKRVTLAPVISTGGETVSYQWIEVTRIENTSGGTIIHSRYLPSETGPQLTVAAGANMTQYRLRVTNASGQANSPLFTVVPWFERRAAPPVRNAKWLGSACVAVGPDEVNTSTDGLSWTRRAIFSAKYLRDVALGNGVYVASAERGVFSSVDLENWVERTLPIDVGQQTRGATSVAWGAPGALLPSATAVSPITLGTV